MEKNAGRERNRVERLFARSRKVDERSQLERRSHYSFEQVRNFFKNIHFIDHMRYFSNTCYSTGVF